MFTALKEIANKEKLWFLWFPWQPGPTPEWDSEALPVVVPKAGSGEGQRNNSLALMCVLQLVMPRRVFHECCVSKSIPQVV